MARITDKVCRRGESAHEGLLKTLKSLISPDAENALASGIAANWNAGTCGTTVYIEPLTGSQSASRLGTLNEQDLAQEDGEKHTKRESK